MSESPIRNLTLYKIFPAVWCVLFWLSLLEFPSVIAGEELDPSWMLSLAHFFKTNAQLGQDFIFTFGPLGVLGTPIYHPDLFAHKLIWEFVIKLSIALVALVFMAGLRNTFIKSAFAGLCLIVLPITSDPQYFFLITISGILLVQKRNIPKWIIAAIAVLVSCAAMVKFTYFVYSCVVIFIAVVFGFLRQEKKYAMLVGMAFLLGNIGIWILCGQSILNIPAYLNGSFELMVGYSGAMGIWPVPRQNIEWMVALGVMALLVIVGILCGWKKPVNSDEVGIWLIVLIGVGIFWKHGFVRHDVHAMVAMVYFVLAPMILWKNINIEGLKDKLRTGLFAFTILFALFGLFLTGRDHGYRPSQYLGSWYGKVSQNTFSFFKPVQRNHERYVAFQNKKQSLALPQILAKVGNQSIDLIGNGQAVVLLNELNWRPRPVFQSYSAYTAWLADKNANYFIGENSPPFLLWKSKTIDERFPLQEETGLVKAIFQNYQCVLQEKGFLLFKKNETARSLNLYSAEKKVIKFGEKIKLPHDKTTPLLLKVKVQGSLIGSLLGIVYKPPYLFLELEFGDEKKERYRILPALVENGFWVIPELGESGKLIDYLENGSANSTKAFRISTFHSFEYCFKDEIQIEILELR